MKKELKSIAEEFHAQLLAETDKFNKALNLKPRDPADKNLSISKEQAIEKALNILNARNENRLEIIDHIEGNLYDTDKIDFKNSWIIHVRPEAPLLDGPYHYIVIDKNTGVMNEIITG